ncbi:uncharacterized protein K02A2.6-like [Ruditapes philippinarum]|uniref:uncharacterized protein K02A2.6-like n=1 Tax=Ruditapes philippinarum TaxID=129788 RepID=UPI00295AA1AE|nr:uncharacterized protein K02A2.6-like [Ruditapes philippinarum]
MDNLPAFPKFDVFADENSLGVRWEKYLDKLENLFVGLGINTRKRKKALLLHYAGDDVYDIYDTLNLREDNENYEETKIGLTAYFKPRKNTQFEIFEFRNMKQLHGESIDQFTTRLRQKAKNCEFSDIDSEIKSQIIQGVISQNMRMQCLQDPDKSLNDLLTKMRSMEISKTQAANMSKDESSQQVVRVKSNPRFSRQSKGFAPKRYQQRSYQTIPEASLSSGRRNYPPERNKKCRNCGGRYPHMSRCPAIGAECNYCHKKNHFISVCRKRQNKVKLIDDEQSDSQVLSEASTSSVSSNECDVLFGFKISDGKKVPKKCIKLNGVDVYVLIDSGSSLNIISEIDLEKMKIRPEIKKTKTKAFAFGQKSPLPFIGKCSLLVESDSKFMTKDFHIVKGNKESLISYELSVELGILPQIQSVHKSVQSKDAYSGLIEEYSQVFTGLGCLKDRKVKFHIDESVVPVAQPPRRVPFHVRAQVEQELKSLEEMDVIEKVIGLPTPWVSNLVAAPKPNAPHEVRVCVDMRKANTAIKTEKNVCPTVDDIILTLNGATVFSRLDLYKAFHQIELDEASRVMTTFQTHIGLFRYKRLNFGVSAAPIIFQNELRQALQGLKGILNIADDIVCFGKTHEEHDANLRALLQRLQDRNLTLNSQKCSFGQSKIKFYGYVFSESGISPDPDKVNAVKNMDRPKSISEIRSFLGLTNYLSKFIDGYSSLTEPLRRLTHKGVKFECTADQEKSFTSLKDTLISDKVMTYFDPRKETELWVDGSPVGCSGILIQNGKIVSYGSKAYNSVQTRYSQTEREALSAVIMIQHFHLYLFGKKFKLITDHAALQSIFNNIKTIQSPRLERWRLKLTTYDFQTVYRPGKMMISDYLSRHPHARHETNTVAEQYISFITDNALPDALKLSDVAKATETDCTLSCVRNALEQNDWKTQKCKLDESFRLYENLNKNQELAVAYTEDGFVLLRGTKLCIPESLQKQTVMLSHEGHQGQSKCKGLLREYCWFPHMDRMVEEICRSCIVCQAASTRIIPDPIKPTLLPRDVFSEVSCDFCGPFPDGYMLLVVICDYSRFPVVERIKSTAADTVIPRLEAIFSIFGYPEVVKTDNGPPFQSRAFREFADNSGFKHKRITPLHPQANGIVERFMAPLQKAI